MMRQNYDIFQLREDAHELDLRNRIMAVEPPRALWPIERAALVPSVHTWATGHCMRCNNLLTIVDRWPVCRQCRLEQIAMKGPQDA